MKPISAMTLFAVAAALAGCVSPSPYLDTRFSEAVNTAARAQTLNPTPRAASPGGLGGVPAAESIGRYNDSFKAPAATFDVIAPSTR